MATEKQYCDAHSGACVNIENLKANVEEIKGKLEHQRGYFEGKFDKVNNDMKDLGDRLKTDIGKLNTDISRQVEEGMEELKNIIKEKEAQTIGKKNMFWGQLYLPLGVLAIWTILQQLLTHFIK
jgi:hypothetical protein